MPDKPTNLARAICETCSKILDTPVTGNPVWCMECSIKGEGPDQLPSFGDTCCGNCGPGLCYVDHATGESSEGWGWQR